MHKYRIIELNDIELSLLKALIEQSIVELKRCIKNAETCGDYDIKKYFEEALEEYRILYNKLC